MKFSALKAKLGGDWHDIWWCAIFERFHPCPFYGTDSFWEEINYGWLEMCYVSPTHEERREEFIKSLRINSIPYYNERFYDYK